MITSNCYINATKLCSQQDKRFDNWLKLAGSAKLIEAVNKDIQKNDIQVVSAPLIRGAENNSSSNQIKTNNDIQRNDPPLIRGGSYEAIKIVISGSKILYGTYVHPLLIPHIASWISPTFAIIVSRIVNDFMTKHLRNENSELSKKIDDQSREIKLQHIESQKKIDDLVISNNNQSLEIQKLMTYAINTNNVVSILNENVESLTDDVQVNTNIIELAVVDRSLKPDRSKELGFSSLFYLMK